jgi:catechol 2,3-dioxygenase-like lactoylglutathione lyase family enzyme
MFDHVTIRVSDRGASERFYESVLGSIGIEKTGSAGDFGDGCPEFAEWDDFSLAPADVEHPVTTGLHIGFCASSREQVDHFWRTGTEAGYRDDGAPGPRPQYRDDYYGGFLLDPDGNSAEAVHHAGLPDDRAIDHLWIRVADLDAARRFYEQVAPHAGFELRHHDSERARFARGDTSFSLVAGPPTKHLHMAFPAGDDARVDRFHADLTGAGHPDNGAPGERPIYHAGYYGGFVLDPDANNIELVNHNRDA